MDGDLYTSVWDSAPAASTSGPESQLEHAFHDLDDEFGEPAAANDDFGDDFGDFGDVQEALVSPAPYGALGEPRDVHDLAMPSSAWGESWQPLSLDPFPQPHVLAARVEELLDAIWPNSIADELMSDQPLRQTDWLNQVLVTRESRNLFQTLFQTYPPTTRPPDWVRSRIRRQHLISLGIPINLDEVLPQSNGRAMPALNITTRPVSTPPGGAQRHTSPPAVAGSRYSSRPGTPQPNRVGPHTAVTNLALGPKPKLESARITELLLLEPDVLRLLPLHVLEAHLTSLRDYTADASALLAHLAETKDALQQDSETYNGLIGELVGEAQKSKATQRGRTAPKRSTAFS